MTPPPLNLLCVRVRARLHVRGDGRRQMACHPVLLCSLGAADLFPHQLLFRRAALTREVPGDEHGGQDGALRITKGEPGVKRGSVHTCTRIELPQI